MEAATAIGRVHVSPALASAFDRDCRAIHERCYSQWDCRHRRLHIPSPVVEPRYESQHCPGWHKKMECPANKGWSEAGDLIVRLDSVANPSGRIVNQTGKT